MSARKIHYLREVFNEFGFSDTSFIAKPRFPVFFQRGAAINLSYQPTKQRKPPAAVVDISIG